ncbi:hypothetical protein KVT40_007442 [Elsinoe batatas]|uniref:Uncharacterized protein n=1 Tax=Elsinoe batatas TaxID=2601811 RepID=A0A8K0PAA2_9PEZI|nr:hypothetical protein KVT40_007442 [Elsinoe batatas]
MRRILATTAALFFSCLILFYIHSLVSPSNPITSHSHAAHYEPDKLTASHPLLPPNETIPWSYHTALHAHRLTLLRKGGEEQNYVQVRRDWKDLGRVMRWLLEEEGDKRAEEVARRSREVFRDRYLSPAAEACYWRELVRGWRQVQGFEPKFWEETEEGKGKEKKKVRRARGVPFESYAIMEATDWEMPTKPRKICEYD